jgi:uncharacterized protein
MRAWRIKIMLIGCNWSNALELLIQNNIQQVDYIKTGAYSTFEKQLDKMRSICPILLHGLGYSERIGMSDINTVDFIRANRLLTECGSPHLGVHLAIRNSDMNPGMTEEDVYHILFDQTLLFKRQLSVPLLLENTPDTPKDRNMFNHYPFAKADLISKLLDESDVGFLLDLTHAKLTAKFNNWDVREYIQNLPIDRVKEIHVNGSGYDAQGFPEDTHDAMQDEDYTLLEWVLKHANPNIVTLEYGTGDFQDLLRSADLLNEQINNIQRICS